MTKMISRGILLCMTILALAACSGVKVSRVDTHEEIALTDRWNDKDSELVANAMIEDMLSFPWLGRFRQDFPDRRPTITIQRIQNKSHETIPVDTFVNDLKRAIIRSNKADFIVSGEERSRVREELKEQDTFASEETRMQMGQEQGANFALSGTINSIVDQLDGERVTFYQVDLKLINLQTTREVWNGQKKIKKLLERSRFGL